MKIFVKVKAGAKQEKIEKVGENKYNVFIKERPQKGAANRGLVKAVARYLGVSSNHVSIISGHKSRNKIVEIK